MCISKRTISIIIPVYNEEKIIGETLEKVCSYHNAEVIVVDGQSEDVTLEIVKKYPVKVVLTSEGRANQLNQGAEVSRGEILVFLHADCWIEEGSLEEIRNCIKRGFIGGCFAQRIASKRFVYRLIETSGNLRAKLFRVFYGDQAIFISRKVFFKVGGFDKVDLFEDTIFSKKIKGIGRTCVLNKKVYASARRWEKQGVVKTTLINWLLTTCFLLKVAPHRLKKIYHQIR